MGFWEYRRSLLAAFLVCITLIGSLLVDWPSLLPMHQSSKNPVIITTQSNKTTTVLVWYWAFGFRPSISGDVCMEMYGIPNCTLTDDRSLFSQADFVIFHNRELIQRSQSLPKQLARPQNQGWVWFSMESPAHNGNVKPFNGYFNYTMSYRRDADVYTPYGQMVPHDIGTGFTAEDFIPENKSSLACWVVSNFAAHHKRTAVYNRLKTIIPVKVYGGAVNKRLGGDQLLPTISRCHFYLAFENSIFKDYITEKFWNAFRGGAIPVVLGPPRTDYEAVAQKDSFIHLDDFKSLEELGEFLKKLAQDKKRYASYFNWRLKYKVQNSRDWQRESYCGMCKEVNRLPKHKVYKDFATWEWK